MPKWDFNKVGNRCWSVILIKLQSKFIKITLQHWCSVNLLHIFRIAFKNTSEGLLLSTVCTSVRIWISYRSVFRTMSNINDWNFRESSEGLLTLTIFAKIHQRCLEKSYASMLYLEYRMLHNSMQYLKENNNLVEWRLQMQQRDRIYSKNLWPWISHHWLINFVDKMILKYFDIRYIISLSYIHIFVYYTNIHMYNLSIYLSIYLSISLSLSMYPYVIYGILIDDPMRT